MYRMGISSKFKLDSVILYIMFTELILGGLGKLFGFPVRMGIFALGLAYTIYYFIGNKVKLSKRAWIYTIIIIVFAIYGAVIGLIRGNSISNIIADANVFVTVLYIVIFISLIRDRKEIIKKLASLFIVYSVILSIVTFIIFKWSYFAIGNGVNVIDILLKVESVVNYGFITGMLYSDTYARVYTTNGIFMQIAVALCLIRLAYKNKIKFFSFESFSILFLILGIIASGTRGYWIGTVVVVVLAVFFIRRTNKVALLCNLLIVFIGLGITFATMGGTDDGSKTITTEIINRANTSKDFSENEVSNSVRNIQARHLLANISNHPIIGSGFGSVMYDYEKETGRSGLNVELYYLELWYKTGAIGMIMMFAVLTHALWSAYRIGKYNCDLEERIIVKGWSLGFITALASGMSNPYFAGAHGFFIPLFLVIICEVYENKETKVEFFQLFKHAL